MEIPIIQIGNSKGIRLSKTVLEKYNFTDTVELVLEKDYLVIKPKKTPRQGWDNVFKTMHENGDDNLLLPDVLDDENFEEWK